MIDINELTMAQVKEIANMVAGTSPHPFKIGGKYFFRTVTHAHTGQVKAVKGNFLVLENATWIADTGRFANALKDEVFDEVEPFTSDCILNMETIIDATELHGELPKYQK